MTSFFTVKRIRPYEANRFVVAMALEQLGYFKSNVLSVVLKNQILYPERKFC